MNLLLPVHFSETIKTKFLEFDILKVLFSSPNVCTPMIVILVRALSALERDVLRCPLTFN